MGRSAIASGEVIRLPLADGEYITVKTELNAGEALDLDESPGSRTLATVIAFLVGWSLVGDADQPIPYSVAQSLEERRDTLRALRAATFNEITDVLLPHIRASRRAIEEKKTAPEPALVS
jgi:hypothetical protein